MNIEKQLELEADMVCRGANLFHAHQTKLIDRGEGHATSAAKRLTADIVLDAAAVLQSRIPKGPGRRAPYVKFLVQLDLKRVSLIAIRTMLSMAYQNQTVTSVASAIGGRVEDDLMFDTFERAHGAYYAKIMETLTGKHAHSYRHQHKALRHGAMEKGMEWEPWSPTDKVNVGMVLIDAIGGVTDLFETVNVKTRNKTERFLQYSAAAEEWFTDHNDAMSIMRPAASPLIVPPREWTTIWDGGYHSPHMTHRFPLIKVKDRQHRKEVSKHKDWGNTLAAVNNWQAQPWTINSTVLDTMKEVYTKNLGVGIPRSEPIEPVPFPLPATFDRDLATEEELAQFMRWKREATLAYTAERERKGRCYQFIRALHMAQEYTQYDQFYFTYQADFRGRFYCTSAGLNPQGADFQKGLLASAARLPLGPEGGYWFRVHGANCFGVDKVSYDDRVQWVIEHADAIIASGTDPIAHRDFWGNADSPWQFLAFAVEYAAWAASGYSTGFETNVTVALDGTCNGLQHFSAMLRDSVGGAAVNLVDHDRPSDIYGIVAERVLAALSELRAGGCEDAGRWIDLGINRKCTKRPVMTLPYGSTRTSCREYIEDYLYEVENADAIFPGYHAKYKASQYLTPIVWRAMEETLTAAMEAMGWLQGAARTLGRADQFPSWTSPSGFLAVQRTCEYDVEVIKTVLLGSLAVKPQGRAEYSIGTPTDRVHKVRQANSIAPNFVHSCDAAHMVLTTNLFGSKFMWLVHDSYGAHPAHIPALAEAIRSAFVDMYQTCPLTAFAEANGLTPEHIPAQGELVLEDVIKAKYFFG